jgi:very-short-patch-repair endonuclease
VVPQSRIPLSASIAPEIDARIATLAHAQHGILTAAQLRHCGLSPHAISRRTRAGRLHRLYDKVYAVGFEPTSRVSRLMAATLAAGSSAALSHHTAANVWNIWRQNLSDIHVTTVQGNRPPGVRVHRVRDFPPEHVTLRNGLRVTTIPRTVIDPASDLTAAQLAFVLHQAAYERLLDVEEVKEAVADSLGRNGIHRVREALVFHECGSAGTRSMLEDSALARILNAGIENPLINVRVRMGNGKRFELDMHWPRAKVCVEIDGEGHRRARSRRGDMARDDAMRACGWTVLRFTETDVLQRHRRMTRSIRHALLADRAQRDLPVATA